MALPKCKALTQHPFTLTQVVAGDGVSASRGAFGSVDANSQVYNVTGSAVGDLIADFRGAQIYVKHFAVPDNLNAQTQADWRKWIPLLYEAELYDKLFHPITLLGACMNMMGIISVDFCKYRQLAARMAPNVARYFIGTPANRTVVFIQMERLPDQRLDAYIRPIGRTLQIVQRQYETSAIGTQMHRTYTERSRAGRPMPEFEPAIDNLKRIFFQLAFGFLFFEKFRLMHNDSHMNNIFYTLLPREEDYAFIVNGEVFVIRLDRRIVLFDLDRGFKPFMNNYATTRASFLAQDNAGNKYENTMLTDRNNRLCTLRLECADFMPGVDFLRTMVFLHLYLKELNGAADFIKHHTVPPAQHGNFDRVKDANPFSSKLPGQTDEHIYNLVRGTRIIKPFVEIMRGCATARYNSIAEYPHRGTPLGGYIYDDFFDANNKLVETAAIARMNEIYRSGKFVFPGFIMPRT